jgi:hypothetical protein
VRPLTTLTKLGPATAIAIVFGGYAPPPGLYLQYGGPTKSAGTLEDPAGFEGSWAVTGGTGRFDGGSGAAPTPAPPLEIGGSFI